MNKNGFYTYVPVSFLILIPLPGRLAYGLVAIFLLYLFSIFAVIFKEISSRFFTEDFSCVIVSVLLISLCILFRQFLILFSPVLAFVIGLSFFMIAFASFIISDIYSPKIRSLSSSLSSSFSRCTVFSVFALVFFILKDVLGYGSLSLPSSTGILEISLFKSGLPFFASIPGSIFLLFIFIVVFSIVQTNFEIIENMGEKE